MMTALALDYQCMCNPGFKYASRDTFTTHFRSKRHLAWQSTQQERDIRIELGRKEKEIAVLKRQIDSLEQRIELIEKERAAAKTSIVL